MSVHVLFGKLDANGEHANGDDDASKLEGNMIDAFSIIVSPGPRVEDVCAIRT
jgi:hypothetical protein